MTQSKGSLKSLRKELIMELLREATRNCKATWLRERAKLLSNLVLQHRRGKPSESSTCGPGQRNAATVPSPPQGSEWVQVGWQGEGQPLFFFCSTSSDGHSHGLNPDESHRVWNAGVGMCRNQPLQGTEGRGSRNGKAQMENYKQKCLLAV